MSATSFAKPRALRVLMLSTAAAFAAASAHAACPAVTGADLRGLSPAFPNQFELAEFEAAASCELGFSANPNIATLSAQILGNPETLPDVAERLPSEPLVMVPYAQVGQYGGSFKGYSNATEAGTSDILSIRHVNLVRFSDDLATIVPNIAKSWEWNDDFTVLTLSLRDGHKWSDGAPFTSADIVFWYEGLVLDQNVIESPKERFLSAGEPMKVEAVDPTTVRFTLNAPKPALLAQFATDYAQPFQPAHILGRFHPKINAEADALAKEAGFENGYEVINFYYGQSDWKDVPQPILKDPAKAETLVGMGFPAVAPTLESHIVVEDTLEGRRAVANPFYHIVDTAGQQLPYIEEIDEVYVPDEDVRVAQMVAGKITYKAQSVNLPSAPALLQNAETGGYRVELRPTIGMQVVSFNLTAADEARRAVFNEKDFRVAMSHAINREQINEIAFFGQGEPTQYTGFDADTASFVTDDLKKAFTAYDPAKAAELLDAVGVTDKDGDGDRDLPNGDEFRLQIRFSTQGSSSELVEIVAQNWSDIGVPTTIKEVTSDEYRASQSANELDVHVWQKGQPLAVLAGDTQELVPPYGSFFSLRNGMLWAQYETTNGAEGVEPPASVAEMRELTGEFTTLVPGSERSNEVGAAIAQKVVDDFFFIGTVKAVAPIYANNALGNFRTPRTWSYEYYRVYPYNPSQWFLASN